MKLDKITIAVAELTKTVGEYISGQVGAISDINIEHKGLHDLVTFVDKESEAQLVSGLSKIFPDAGFIAEENQSLKKHPENNWIIDPLDGTTNYIHQVPVFSISVALTLGNSLAIGVVYEINRKECFYAWKNAGAYLNGSKIKVSNTQNLDNALLATGFPYSDFTLLDQYLGLFRELMTSSRGIRRLGSAAVDLAYVACGRFDAFFEYSLNPWDVAAGAFIVKEAGGKVTDFENGDNFIEGRQIFASNNALHANLIERFGNYF